MTDIGIPVGGASWIPISRRALIGVILFMLGVIAVFSSSAAVREEIETQICNNKFLKFVIQTVEPELYANKCGCPNSLDFRFSCNSQYIPIVL